jgi:hypothetical protein
MSTLKSSAEDLTLNADGSGNDIKFQSNGSEVASIDQAGVVTASGVSLAASGTLTTASGNDLNIVYPDTRSLFIKEAGTTHVSVNNVGNVTVESGNLVIGTAGKGIDFSAQTSADSVSGVSTGDEVLDHYEEGTWTPVFSDGTNDMTMNATYGGRYTRIGNTVFITAYAVATAEGSPTGGIAVYGLPFTVANSNDDYAAISVGYAGALNLADAYAVTGYIQINQTYAALYVWDSTAGTTSMSKEEISSNGAMIIHGQYRVA